MKLRIRQLGAVLLAFCIICSGRATTFYVDLRSANPAPPFSDWSTASTTIQIAVDAASDGDTILVTNGIYNTGGRILAGDSTTNRLSVTKALLVQSVNGPASTVIQGYQVPGKTNGTASIRCVYLTNNAALVGFTLTGGATQRVFDGRGGGVLCGSGSAVVSNCIVLGNTANAGGGIYNGTILDCLIVSNYASQGAGALSCTLTNCLLAWNSATGNGGGALYCTLANCLLATNSVVNVSYRDYGGGGAYNSSLYDCTIIGNISTGPGGGLSGGTATNCKLFGNYCSGGSGGGAVRPILNNCLVVGNTSLFGGGVGGGTVTGCVIVSNYCFSCDSAGADVGTVNNSIVRYNFSTDTPGIERNYAVYFFSYMNSCCTWPLPARVGHISGNITNDPGFMNLTDGDYHLWSNSPCINSGHNLYVPTSSDLDGNPRVVGGTVDIGPYEYQTPTSILSYAWAQLYGQVTDGSVDYLDPDGTGMLNWQKSVADLNPTNPASVLAMLTNLTNNNAGVTVSWQGVNTRTYYLLRATNLAALPAFSALQSNLVGESGINTFTDVSATNGGPYFYRVGVQ